MALPPCLPHREDPKLDEIELRFLDHLVASVHSMRDMTSASDLNSLEPEAHLKVVHAWESIARGLIASRAVHVRQQVNRSRLLSELRRMTANDFLIIHVHSQNAALVVHRLAEYALPHEKE